jgi:hypothetical protein
MQSKDISASLRLPGDDFALPAHPKDIVTLQGFGDKAKIIAGPSGVCKGVNSCTPTLHG